MAEFNYTARSESGDITRGKVNAESKQAALSALNQKGLHPLTVEKPKKGLADIEIPLPGQNKVKTQDLVMFTRQFSTMINAGVPLLKSLSTMRDQTESEALSRILEEVTSKVEGGVSLSEALGEHPDAFSDVYVNMVKAGEEGGILDDIMERLANQVEKDADIKGKLRSALTYPGVICVVAIGAVVFLMTSIIPRFSEIFENAGIDLPIQTRILLGLSDFLLNYGFFILGALVVAGIFLIRFIRTSKGKFMFDSLLLKMPILGPVVLKVNTARFAQTFSSLSIAGVSVINSLEVTSGALSNSVVQKGIKDSVEKIKNGQSISQSLTEAEIFPGIVTQMASVGEETGDIAEVLTKVAVFYEKEVDRTVASISSIIEPILIVGLGSIVGLIVASVFGPLSEITGSI